MLLRSSLALQIWLLWGEPPATDALYEVLTSMKLVFPFHGDGTEYGELKA